MPVFRLNDDELTFPLPALAEPGGLLAIGADLRPERLIVAYRHGIFPWFEEDGYFYWYSPDPRFVLFPGELKVHKSMRSIFNQKKFEYTLDESFEDVVRACAGTKRVGQEAGTWISEAFVSAYTDLYQRGIAHSVEVRQDGALVGGLYGISIGKIFYGESMFARAPNASKAGFIALARALQQSGFWLIDCQQETAHLASLGARGISRDLFMEYMMKNYYEKTLIGKWRFSETGGVEQIKAPAR